MNASELRRLAAERPELSEVVAGLLAAEAGNRALGCELLSADPTEWAWTVHEELVDSPHGGNAGGTVREELVAFRRRESPGPFPLWLVGPSGARMVTAGEVTTYEDGRVAAVMRREPGGARR